MELYEEDVFEEDYVPVYKVEDVMAFLLKSGYEPTGVVSYKGKRVTSSLPDVINELNVVVNTPSSEYKSMDINVDEFAYQISSQGVYEDNKFQKNLTKDWQDYLLEKYGEKYGIRLVNHLTSELDYTKNNKMVLDNMLKEHIARTIDTSGDKAIIKDILINKKVRETKERYFALKSNNLLGEIDAQGNASLKIARAIDGYDEEINQQLQRLENVKEYLASIWEESLGGTKL